MTIAENIESNNKIHKCPVNQDIPSQDLTWNHVLAAEKEKIYFIKIIDYLNKARGQGKIIYPESKNVFNAIKLTPFAKVKVIILGQDPYHGPGQAHGLSFSVPFGIMQPPSLRNIFLEIKNDVGIEPPKHGNLQKWAEQGVLLLNATLTVEANQAHSHADLGWQEFTDHIIKELSYHKENLVFLLWGSYAQKKIELIDQKKHFILTAPHPSPLSAHRGFLGCKHFSKTNEILQKIGQEPINWQL